MKIAYKHLLEFLHDDPEIKDLSTRLFQLGHEHEIEGSIFDMEFTPNRGDCLSLVGLARDLNIFYPIKNSTKIYSNDIPILELDFTNNADDECPSISFLNIEIEKPNTAYCNYLEDYFTDLEINKNNFFTDISNYLAYEMGQPTHCYDFDTLEGNISLENKEISTQFKSLLGKSIELSNKNLVFMNNKNVINLAGIMGDIKSACSKNTTNVLVECAYFRPESIMGKAIKYNLHSDASHKFERGVDINCHENVLRRFIQIVDDNAKINKVEIYKNSLKSFKRTKLDFNIRKVNTILGTDVNSAFYKNALEKLGFEVDESVIVPSYRSDVTHQNDLAEELARVIGYDNLPRKNINIKNILSKKNLTTEDKIKLFLIENGFHEVINSPFCNKNEKLSISVDNPLDSNRKYLRRSMTGSLVENLIYNEKRQKDSIKLFEVSELYSINEEQDVIQEKKLGLVVSGRKGRNYKDFSIKMDEDYLNDIFNPLDIDIQNDILSINRSSLDSKIKTPIYALELELDRLTECLKNYEPSIELLNHFVQYSPISEFPSSSRDLSFSVSNESSVSYLINEINQASSTNLKELFMFDFYENKKTNETKVGYRFIFQSYKKTLKDNEIQEELNDIIKPLFGIKGVTLPGLK